MKFLLERLKAFSVSVRDKLNGNSFGGWLLHRKIPIGIVAVFLALSLTAAVVFLPHPQQDVIQPEPAPAESEVTEPETTESEPEEPPVIEEPVVSELPAATAPAPQQTPAVKKPAPTPSVTPSVPSGGDYKYNTNIDPNNNVFLDSMVYTGYNLAKHRADGNMWVYILAANKRGLGYLSGIGYGGGCTGYETLNGKPDLAAFRRGGMVCASYVTYVYFNYLPNVAGIDTSALPRPTRPTSANDWYIAAKEWVRLGYSVSIPFTASKTSSGFINFNSTQTIPIGSIILFRDAKKNQDFGSHVAIYAGYVNGYNWLFHVGNSNGPEMCAIERMYFGPDPQWPLMVVSTPSNVRMTALLEILLADDTGAAVPGVEFVLQNSAGQQVGAGTTDAAGRLVFEGLAYGNYTLTQRVPAGYTCSEPVRALNLTTANNSYTTVRVAVAKEPPPPTDDAPDKQQPSSPPDENSSDERTGTDDTSSGT